VTIALLEKDWLDLWYENNPLSRYTDPEDDSDILYPCPEMIGKGYERIIQLRGIELLLIDETYVDDLSIISPPDTDDADDECIEFGFNLAGVYADRAGGHNFLQWTGLPAWRASDSGICIASGKQRILKVDIHLESVDVLRSFVSGDRSALPSALQALLEEGRSQPYDDLGIITPAMKLALNQIINCPYQGFTKQIYLEAKCLELIALKLEQLAAAATELSITLKPDDRDRIYHARDILTLNPDNPPTLLELARQVGLNDCTLKKGFRQIFGTTAFGYLHSYRMEQAKTLLLEQRLSVSQVAQAVGYASRSAFIAAFRKQFGANPSAFALINSV
jgi:AraC family transcriptional regulator, transcriptional activator of the genes for pyochelin and ferripyochelin receptors